MYVVDRYATHSIAERDRAGRAEAVRRFTWTLRFMHVNWQTVAVVQNGLEKDAAWCVIGKRGRVQHEHMPCAPRAVPWIICRQAQWLPLAIWSTP